MHVKQKGHHTLKENFREKRQLLCFDTAGETESSVFRPSSCPESQPPCDDRRRVVPAAPQPSRPGQAGRRGEEPPPLSWVHSHHCPGPRTHHGGAVPVTNQRARSARPRKTKTTFRSIPGSFLESAPAASSTRAASGIQSLHLGNGPHSRAGSPPSRLTRKGLRWEQASPVLPTKLRSDTCTRCSHWPSVLTRGSLQSSLRPSKG